MDRKNRGRQGKRSGRGRSIGVGFSLAVAFWLALFLAADPKAQEVRTAGATFYDVDRAIEVLRNAAVSHQGGPVTVEIFSDVPLMGQEGQESLEALVDGPIRDGILAHTGNPKGGDYLYSILNGIRYTANCYTNPDPSGYCNDLTFTFSYVTTQEEERRMDEEVQALLDSLSLSGKPTKRCRKIYEWVVDHVVYDDTAYLQEDGSYLPSTAYDALTNRRTACQGFASLMYRLLLEAGFDCRVVRGWSPFGDSHSWNIVQIGKKYYYLDATFAATDNDRDGYFLTAQVPHTAEGFDFQGYPMASEDKEVERVRLTYAYFILYPGQYGLVETSITPEGVDEIVSYKSSNPSVVSVDQTGRMDALQSGVATVTVRTGKGFERSFPVYVENWP